jgi:dipeptidase E
MRSASAICSSGHWRPPALIAVIRRGIMRLLLTSSGISNTSIHNALVDLLGKPIAESSALCIPTGMYPFPGGAAGAYQFITGSAAGPMCGLGWKSLGVLELTALPSINEEYWIAAVRETDALLVWGGDPMYLCRWMRESGLADLLPSLHETVYVGVSAGSMLTAPIFGETYDDRDQPFVIDRGLGLVNFALLPHVDHQNHPESSMTNAERVAAELPVPMYAIDDQTAIQVTDGAVEVVSEGHWKLFADQTSPEPY